MHDDLLPSKDGARQRSSDGRAISSSKLARQLIARQTTTDAVCPLGPERSARNGVGKGNNSDYQDGLASLYSLVMTPIWQTLWAITRPAFTNLRTSLLFSPSSDGTICSPLWSPSSSCQTTHPTISVLGWGASLTHGCRQGGVWGNGLAFRSCRCPQNRRAQVGRPRWNSKNS